MLLQTVLAAPNSVPKSPMPTNATDSASSTLS
jgi:hypothetical protein